MRIRHAVAAVLTTAVLALTAACSSDTGTGTATATATATGQAPAAKPAADTNRPRPAQTDLTDLAFQITWDQDTESQKDDLCTALALYGPESAAKEMQTGAHGSTALDWDRFAELLGDRCDAR
ncbi:hypothetical protein ACWDA7_44140 [Streptomyces sp. NPDC001156]